MYLCKDEKNPGWPSACLFLVTVQKPSFLLLHVCNTGDFQDTVSRNFKTMLKTCFKSFTIPNRLKSYLDHVNMENSKLGFFLFMTSSLIIENH